MNNVLDTNPGNPNADLYSILGQLDQFKIENNFYFRLCYPELKGKDDSSCNYWSQSSNPATDSTISGFKPISLAFTKNSYGQEWTGLGKNIHKYAFTYIDDAPNEGNWYSAVGAFSFWPAKPYIPGPRLEPDPASAITKVDLHAYNEERKLILKTKGYNYQYNPFFCFLTIPSLPSTTEAPTTTEGTKTSKVESN